MISFNTQEIITPIGEAFSSFGSSNSKFHTEALAEAPNSARGKSRGGRENIPNA
jgi:hypothetical protein